MDTTAQIARSARAARAAEIARIARAEVKTDARKYALATMTTAVASDHVISYSEVQALVTAQARRQVWMTLVNAIETFAHADDGADDPRDAVDAYEAVAASFERSLRVRRGRSTSAMSDLMDDALADAMVEFLDDYRFRS